MVNFREDGNLVCIHFGTFGYAMCQSVVLNSVASLAVIVKDIIDPDGNTNTALKGNTMYSSV